MQTFTTDIVSKTIAEQQISELKSRLFVVDKAWQVHISKRTDSFAWQIEDDVLRKLRNSIIESLESWQAVTTLIEET